MPLDTYSTDAAQVMQSFGLSAPAPEIVSELKNIIERQADAPQPVAYVEAFQIYEKSKTAFAVVQTGETRLYGNIILKKGVVSP